MRQAVPRRAAGGAPVAVHPVTLIPAGPCPGPAASDINADLMSLPAARTRDRRDCRGGCGVRDAGGGRSGQDTERYRAWSAAGWGRGSRACGMTATSAVEDL
jgi:hypothetical protein